jgi:putative ABC transport system permease protein
MIQNYLKVASRNIVKRKMYSFINAFGLSIGIAFCILIFLFIRDEKSFDLFHENKANLFRMESRWYNTWDPKASERFQNDAWLQTGLLPVLKNDIPEVEMGTRFNGSTGILTFGDKVFNEKITYVDGDFFRMFSFKLTSGNPEKIFRTKEEIVLTPAIAEKYFGDEDPIGKIFTLADGQGRQTSLTVTGLIDAPPANSSLDFAILIPQENRPGYERNLAKFGNFNTATFVQLVPGTDLEKFQLNLDKIVDKLMSNQLKKDREQATVPVPEDVKIFQFQFTNIAGIHLKKEIGWEKVSDPQYSLILGGIALLILLIACINYVSLALTTSTSRRTEVGIRKVVGAQKKQLVYQFGFESIMLAMISMVIGVSMAVLFLPSFNNFTKKSIELDLSAATLAIGVSFMLALIVGVLAGSYPALFLSRFRPAAVLKGGFTSRLQAGFTKPLVVLQFSLSAFLIISSVIMYRQMRFVTTKDLGYDQNQLIIVPTQMGWTDASDNMIIRFRELASQQPSILSVAGTTSSFNQGYSLYGYRIKDENKSAYVYAADPYYIPTLGIDILQGRNFDLSIPSDSNVVIVNEALVKDMKWSDPLNEYLNWQEDSVGLGSKVIGVVKDYHFLSLEKGIEPMFLSMNKKAVGHLMSMIVKVEAGNLPERVEVVGKLFKELAPDKPFEYTFLDEDVAKQYASYKRWMSIMGLATGFAILISCLGLFGLAGINAVNKTKEIGIRKVMGADLRNIFILLNRQYVLLSLIAFAMAAPASYYIMNKWLADFKFHITVGWELFAVSMVGGLLVALITVSYHAIKASLVNPAETLKYE